MPTATPGVPKTNGLIERAVRRVKERGRKFNSQAGFAKEWWEYACPAACFAMQISVAEGSSVPAYQLRHKVACKAVHYLYGELVEYMPTPVIGKEPAPFDSRTCLGLFVGWHTNPGSIFTGDYLIADFEKFKLAPDSNRRRFAFIGRRRFGRSSNRLLDFR
jgi:hypothetical protein